MRTTASAIVNPPSTHPLIPSSSALALPTLPPTVKHQHLLRNGQGDLGAVKIARWLVDAGVMRREHWRGSAAPSCAAALTEYINRFRPDPIAKLNVIFGDKACDDHDHHSPDHSLLDYSYGGVEFYLASNHLPKGVTVGGIVTFLGGFDDGPVIYHIGQTILEMEQRLPRAGQTILATLDCGLNRSARACTPRLAFGWAQDHYWMGEGDESYMVDEHASQFLEAKDKNKPTDNEWAVARQLAIDDGHFFTREDLEAGRPLWASTGGIHPIAKPDRIPARRFAKKQRPLWDALIALHRYLDTTETKELHDSRYFEGMNWLVCPFLLRWDKKDNLTQLWDDVMENIANGGEVDAAAIALFAFQDAMSFERALLRVRKFYELLQLCENVIRHLGRRVN